MRINILDCTSQRCTGRVRTIVASVQTLVHQQIYGPLYRHLCLTTTWLVRFPATTHNLSLLRSSSFDEKTIHSLPLWKRGRQTLSPLPFELRHNRVLMMITFLRVLSFLWFWKNNSERVEGYSLVHAAQSTPRCSRSRY